MTIMMRQGQGMLDLQVRRYCIIYWTAGQPMQQVSSIGIENPELLIQRATWCQLRRSGLRRDATVPSFRRNIRTLYIQKNWLGDWSDISLLVKFSKFSSNSIEVKLIHLFMHLIQQWLASPEVAQQGSICMLKDWDWYNESLWIGMQKEWSWIAMQAMTIASTGCCKRSRSSRRRRQEQQDKSGEFLLWSPTPNPNSTVVDRWQKSEIQEFQKSAGAGARTYFWGFSSARCTRIQRAGMHNRFSNHIWIIFITLQTVFSLHTCHTISYFTLAIHTALAWGLIWETAYAFLPRPSKRFSTIHLLTIWMLCSMVL